MNSQGARSTPNFEFLLADNMIIQITSSSICLFLLSTHINYLKDNPVVYLTQAQPRVSNTKPLSSSHLIEVRVTFPAHSPILQVPVPWSMWYEQRHGNDIQYLDLDPYSSQYNISQPIINDDSQYWPFNMVSCSINFLELGCCRRYPISLRLQHS